MTILFCAFEGKPLILRLYGTCKMYHHGDPEWEDLIGLFPQDVGSRQLFDLQIEMVQTSCGFGVPLMEFQEERTILTDWSSRKGEEGIKAYWSEKNSKSINNFPTDMKD